MYYANVEKMAFLFRVSLNYFKSNLSFVLLSVLSLFFMKQLFHPRASVLRVALIGAVVLFCSILVGCEPEHTKIPDRAVYLRRNINDEGLLSAGKYLYVTTPTLDSDRLGYAGIIVVYSYDELEPYCSFDLACPNCVSPTIRVGVPSDLLVCTCPECGERYDLFYGLGIPLRGISKVAMKKYTAYIDPFDNRYIKVEP